MTKLRKITKSQVKAKIRKNGFWKGYICGCKVAPYHICGGWHIGFPVNWEDIATMEDTLTHWNYYNSCNELGYYPAYYEVVK